MSGRRYPPWARGWFSRFFYNLYCEWRDDVTPAGKCLVYGIALSGFGCVTPAIPIYQLFCALIVTLVCVAGVASLFRPRVTFEGDFGTRAAVGTAVRHRFRVTNVGWLPAYDLCLGQTEFPPTLATPGHSPRHPELRRGESVDLALALTPLRRGLIEVPPVRAFSLFPFGILRSGWSFHAVPPLLVTPELFPVGPVAIAGAGRSQVGGPMISARAGESMEYVGNRDYVPGEPIGRLDVKAWARTGRPVIREFHDEQSAAVAVVLATGRPRSLAERLGGKEDATFEAAVSVAAGLVESLAAASLGPEALILGGEPVDLRSPAGSPREAALERLAVVEPDRRTTAGDTLGALSPRLDELSSVLFVLTEWDESWGAVFDRVAAEGCETGGFLVEDGTGDRDAVVPHTLRVLTVDAVEAARNRPPSSVRPRGRA